MTALVWCLIYMGLLGILSHYVGESLPRSWFSYDAAPFKPYAWESLVSGAGRIICQI